MPNHCEEQCNENPALGGHLLYVQFYVYDYSQLFSYLQFLFLHIRTIAIVHLCTKHIMFMTYIANA